MFTTEIVRVRDLQVGDVIVECEKDYFSCERVIALVHDNRTKYTRLRLEGRVLFDSSVHGGSRWFSKYELHTLNERDAKPVLKVVQ